MKILKLIINQYFLLFLILVIGFSVRLYKIDSPVADWHSWRQADTAAVSRNFFQNGFTPFLPRYDDMSWVSEVPKNGIPLDNPNHYRLVEFPIYNTFVYLAYLLNGGVDEKFARLVSILFSLGSTIFIYIITKRYFDSITAYLAALLFAILPFSIFFSRVILPEPTLVFFCLGMFYFTDLWIQKNTRLLFILSALFGMSAFLIKPQAIFYLLPLIFIYYQKEANWWPIPRRYWFWGITVLLPFAVWRVWINQHPEGIPASNWLFNGTHIRFRPAFWRWIIGDRLGREILSVGGSFLFFLGIVKKWTSKEGPLLHLFAFSAFLFVIIFATGNVTHDYYQTFIVPVFVIFAARGAILLLKGTEGFLPRIWTIPIAFLFLFLTIYLTWGEVKGLYQINNGVIVDAGKEANRLLPKDAKVNAPYQGDTAFLYQINRPGWPRHEWTDTLIKHFGINYYVSINFDERTNWAMRKYRVIEKTDKFVIVDLTSINPNFNKTYDLEPQP